MINARFNATFAASILCFGLLAAIWSPKTGAVSSLVIESLDTGEWVEASANEPLYLSLGGVGNVMLFKGAKARLATFTVADKQVILVVTLVSGDLVVGLEQKSTAYINTGKTIFAAAPDSLFYTGLRGENAFFDTSETLRDRLGDWTIRVPSLASLVSGNWAIRVPNLALPEPSKAETIKPLSSVSLSPTRNFNFATTVGAIGHVESVGTIKINQMAVARDSLLMGSELIQAPDGTSARATLNGVAQVTLVGGSQARLMTQSVGGAEGDRILAATLLSGGLVVQLDSSVAGYVEAAGSTYLASRGARFRARLLEGHAIFEMIEGIGFEKGEWSLNAQLVTDLVKKMTQGRAQGQSTSTGSRRYALRPVGLNSNLVVRAGSTRQIQVRVTNEEGRPATGVPVVFTLGTSDAGGSLVGSFGPLVTANTSERIFTDPNGIASVNFVASDNVNTGSITATAENTNSSWDGQVNVLKVTPGFWAPQNAIPAIATLGAAATIGIIKAATKDSKLPVQPVGPTIIKP